METKRITDMPGMPFLWKVDNLYLAGQPAMESFSHIKKLGVKKIINLRSNNEKDFKEDIAKIKELDLEYVQFPILDESGQLSFENCKKLSEMLDETNPHFIHCGSANRVGGWLITYLVTYRNMDFEQAVEIASNNGLTNPGFIEQAQAVIDNA